jgi:hypothetical protein
VFSYELPTRFIGAGLLAALAGWVVIAWLAAGGLARRRGLTFLAALLDPRSWLLEPLLGVQARFALLAWLLLSGSIAWAVSDLARLAAR